jgi:hypothetical protein
MDLGYHAKYRPLIIELLSELQANKSPNDGRYYNWHVISETGHDSKLQSCIKKEISIHTCKPISNLPISYS